MSATIPTYHDAWRAIFRYCPNLELVTLYMCGDKTINYLLKIAQGLLGEGYYFPLLQEFKGITGLDLRNDYVFGLKLISSLPLPPQLTTLKLQLGQLLVLDKVLPATLTSLNIESYINRRREDSNRVNLATLPRSLVELVVLCDGIPNIRWEMDQDYSTDIYPNLTSISVGRVTFDDCQHLNALITAAPSLTNLKTHYYANPRKGVIVPSFPYPERIRTLTLNGLPYHRSSLDYLALFPTVELEVGFLSLGEPHDKAMLDEIIDLLPYHTTSLSIMAPRNFYKLARLQQLRALTFNNFSSDAVFDISLPNLLTLVASGKQQQKIIVPATVTDLDSMRYYRLEDLDYILPEQFKPRRLVSLACPRMLELTLIQTASLQILSIQSCATLFKPLCVRITTLNHLKGLHVTLADVVTVIGKTAIQDLLTACSGLPHLKELSIVVKHSNIESSDATLDFGELILPTELQVLRLVVHDSLNMLRDPVQLMANVSIKTFPINLSGFSLSGVSIAIDDLLALRNCPKLRGLSVLGLDVSLTDFQRLLTVLPQYMLDVTIQLRKREVEGDIGIPVPSEIAAIINAHRRYLITVKWNSSTFLSIQ